MRHSLTKTPQFYVTAPHECPYLDQKIERKLFTSLDGADAQSLNDALSKQGFRRSQNVLYRPSCSECSACLSARIPIAGFEFSKSENRVLKRNSSLSREIKTPWATDKQFNLFKKYVQRRHEKGGMAGMNEFEFSAMIEETSVKTLICEYSTDKNIFAVSITDEIEDGLSMVYSFYEPDFPELSLGKFMILDHIRLAKEMGLSYLYLGYWVKGSKKMNYKAQYTPLEIFSNGEWSLLKDNEDTKISQGTNTFQKSNDTIYLPKSSV